MNAGIAIKLPRSQENSANSHLWCLLHTASAGKTERHFLVIMPKGPQKRRDPATGGDLEPGPWRRRRQPMVQRVISPQSYMGSTAGPLTAPQWFGQLPSHICKMPQQKKNILPGAVTHSGYISSVKK